MLMYMRFHSSYPRAVPLNKCEVQFPALGKWGAEVTSLQFPLTLSWAILHKVQGLTLDEIVVDMQGRFSPGQAYVVEWNPYKVYTFLITILQV